MLTCSNRVKELFQICKIKFENTNQQKILISQNIIIINYAKLCIKEENLDMKVLSQINYMKIFKLMILPCELIEIRGNYRPKNEKCFR